MSEFVEVKTAYLVGAALDWAVLNATNGDGPDWRLIDGALFIVGLRDVCVGMDGMDQQEFIEPFHPSTRWQDGGPMIESRLIELGAPTESGSFAGIWHANHEWGHINGHQGPTPLIAACRAIVASVLGDTVSVPKELV